MNCDVESYRAVLLLVLYIYVLGAFFALLLLELAPVPIASCDTFKGETLEES